MIPTLHIHGAIGEEGNSPPALGNFLTAHKAQPVTLVVNSFGGIASDSAAMLALIEQHGHVRVEIIGVAASAASLLIMGAAEIAMHNAAHLMIHEPSCIAWGTAADFRREADTLEKMSDVYAQAYSRTSGHPVEHIRAWMAAETWMTPDEALALNFCDSLFGDAEPTRTEPVAAFDYTRFKAPPPDLLNLTARKGWSDCAA